VAVGAFRARAVEWRDSADGWANASAAFDTAGFGSNYGSRTGFLEDGEAVTFTWAAFNLTQDWDQLFRGKM
jgi:hypothetical protein